jgi:uncharacterized protein with HEPN domain
MEFIKLHTEEITKTDFENDEVLQDSMMFRLIQISENAKKLTDEYRSMHDDIPWFDIYGLKNHIVHEYGHVDMTIVFETLHQDIPYVLNLIKQNH